MAFSEATKDEAFRRSRGQCECTRKEHDHMGRCSKTFTRYGGGWEAHHKTAQSSGGGNELSNCEILCERCHKLTETYGR